MKNLRVIFMGTPEFSVSVLENLIKNCHVIAVVTQPDKEVGREKLMRPSPIKLVAQKYHLEVFQPEKIRREYDMLIELKPDIIITCAYGQLIPRKLLEAPKFGCINVHASLLPKLRGGAPIHHAIIDGYQETGITIMYMNEKMDEGNIIAQSKIMIESSDTVGSLHDKLSLLGSKLLIETLPSIIEGSNKSIPQNNDEATYAYTIKREDEIVDFNDESSNIYNKIRGLNPFPGAYVILNDKVVKIYEAYINDKTNTLKGINGEIIEIYDDGIGVKTKDGEIILTVIQFEGKKKMTVKEFLNGYKKDLVGQVFNGGKHE